MRVCFVSLGCAKNLINSEQMIYLMEDAGFEIVSVEDGADVAVVNTCAFIESAKSEAIDQILELAEYKKSGQLRKIIVAGCLAERYRDEVTRELPEVDALVGTGSFDEIVTAVYMAVRGERPCLFGDIDAACPETPRVLSAGPGWAYLKVAEGCDNRCSYCVIPDLRGKYRSRPMENIVSEAQMLVGNGARELILVAQDVSRYGVDLYGKRSLCGLLRELAAIPQLEWIRLHYLYPDEMDDELIDLIATEEKIIKYLDIPIQHISDGILKKMNRRGTGAEIRTLFKKLRERIPGVVLRTSLITGLPGEAEAEFEELCEFLREFKIERAGVFPYSPEEGTPAYSMPRADEEMAVRRAGLIMELQSGIMDTFSEGRVGTALGVLCEGFDDESGLWYGRSEADSPDIDGRVLFDGPACEIGRINKVYITGVSGDDLIGRVTEE